MYNSRGFAWLGIALCFCVAPECCAEIPSRPNVLFILVDDLSWSDLGCYGHAWHQTPNIDRLAESGMRMTDAYAPAPICSASRASILTGKSTARLGFEFVTKDKPGLQEIEGNTKLVAPPFKLNLPLGETTVAETLRDAGYETAFFGKWHLNQHHQRYLGWSPTHGPANQGFEIAVEDFGAHPYAWKKTPPVSLQKPGDYAKDSMVDSVCDYLGAQTDRPFFVMASSFYVHTPVKTPCQWLLDEYEAVIPSDAANRAKRVKYAAFLQTLDHHVGKMIEALNESGRRNNTLVILMSDNGGHPEYTGNGPLRGSKWNLYEGGIRVPMIFSWPGEISANSVCDVPVIGYDVLPTLVDLADGSADAMDGKSLLGSIGYSERENEPAWKDRALVWHFPYYHPERGYSAAKKSIGTDDFEVSQTRPQSAIRVGNHKLLWFAENDRVELYDLNADVGEQVDLSNTERQTAQTLRRQLAHELKRSGARMATERIDAPEK